MTTKELYDKWKAFIADMNRRGIPVPLVRDPKTSAGSVSLTLVFLASIWVQLGLLGKVANAFQGINLDQALQFFYACSALYFGRRWVGKNSTFDASPEDKDKK